MFDTREDNAIVKYIQHSSYTNSDAIWCRKQSTVKLKRILVPSDCRRTIYIWLDEQLRRRAQHFKQRRRSSVATVQIIKWKPQSVQAAWTTYSG